MTSVAVVVPKFPAAPAGFVKGTQKPPCDVECHAVDPRDRRAKLIVLTRKGQACVEAGRVTIEGLEDEITRRLGQRGHRQLRRMLEKLLDAE